MRPWTNRISVAWARTFLWNQSVLVLAGMTATMVLPLAASSLIFADQSFILEKLGRTKDEGRTSTLGVVDLRTGVERELFRTEDGLVGIAWSPRGDELTALLEPYRGLSADTRQYATMYR